MTTPAISLRNESAPRSMNVPRLIGGLLAHIFQACGALHTLWSALPRGWWIMPCAGMGLMLMLASGQGLSWFVGKYAWTGKDFQEVLGPSLLAAAVVLAIYFWAVERHVCRAWMICLPAALLCREVHFSGTGTGIYVALVLIGIYSVRHRQSLQPVWNCHATSCLWLGACSWYLLAVTVDSGVWKFLPHSHWWGVNLEETLESGGHLGILLGVLTSVLMVVGKPGIRYNRVEGAVHAPAKLWRSVEAIEMSDVAITLRENGPLIVSGPIKLVDHLGNVFELAGNDKGKGNVALCRCGHSQRRPFCDGSHKTCGFIATETAPPTTPDLGTASS